MPCNVVRFGDTTAIVCSRTTRKSCKYCGKAANKLCDYPLRGAKAGKTCDVPMCPTCATHVPPDTDYCRAHAELVKKEDVPQLLL